ncbi:MAG: glycosyltransferase, partial [Actinomycetales bacterium]|nr:glycosyltransferase [Actinomycetales bacterium]
VGVGASLDEANYTELFDVIALHEKHGVAVPRSNAPGIGVLPRGLPTGGYSDEWRSRELTAQVFEKTSRLGERFLIAPFADGNVVAISAAQFVNYFLDVGIRTGFRTSLRDYSIFINEMGYSTVLANRALSLSDPFELVKCEIPTEAAPTLPREWDAYVTHVYNRWSRNDVGPVETFATHFVTGLEKPRVLIDISALPSTVNGTSRNATTFLATLDAALYAGRVDWNITVLVPDEARRAFGLTSERMTFRSTDEALRETFDLGLCVTPVSKPEQLLRLNRTCLRWVVCHLDIIAIRSLPFLSQDVSSKQVVHDTLEWADHTLFISKSAWVDAAMYFPDVALRLDLHSSIVHEGSIASASPIPELASTETTISKLEPGYVLIVGNAHPHQQVAKAQSILSGTGMKIVSFGGQTAENGDVLAIPSGNVSEASMTALFENAVVVVFPSAYEGFGLPIAEIARVGKPCVLFETEVAHEVADLMQLEGRVLFFQDFTELPGKVTEAMSLSPRRHEQLRTIEDFNEDIIALISRTLASAANVENLRRRWSFFMGLENMSRSLAARIAAESPRQSIAVESPRQSLAAKIWQRLHP